MQKQQYKEESLEQLVLILKREKQISTYLYLEKEQTKHKVSRRKAIINIRAEIEQCNIESIKKTKNWYFAKVGKTSKPLSQTDKKRGRQNSK